MLAMLNPGPVCASAQAAKRVSRNVDRTLKFYYLLTQLRVSGRRYFPPSSVLINIAFRDA